MTKRGRPGAGRFHLRKLLLAWHKSRPTGTMKVCAAEPHRKGLPAGHVPLTRDLGVPVFEGGQVVAVLGVGNKDVLYDHDDVELMPLPAGTIWSIVQRKRVHEHLREQIRDDQG